MQTQLKEASIWKSLAFLLRYWRHNVTSIIAVALSTLAAATGDLLLPVFSGKLVDSITYQHNLWRALFQVAILAGLGVMLIVMRYLALAGITRLNLQMMSRVAGDVFWRVQRLSTEWHSGNLAGSVVRRITRGVWSIDQLNEILLLTLLPASFILGGTTLLLAFRWLGLGMVIALGSIGYIFLSVVISLAYVAPAARLSIAQDSKVGGVIADALTCNSVVKAFGAEDREDKRLAHAFNKWSNRIRRTWMHNTYSSTYQLVALLAMRVTIIGGIVWLWSKGHASPGDLTFVLSSYFIIHSYLIDIGQHLSNLQRATNELVELIELHSQSIDVFDCQDAKPIAVSAGEIVFSDVTFQYPSQSKPLFQSVSLSISPGQKIGLVGHSGSGKTTFVKLLHRLYDVSKGNISIDGQNISHITQTSLRSQLALVSQEPLLFHRTLADNIAYARPGAKRLEIEAAAVLANAHEFIIRQPKGYSTVVGERGMKLSGGERQRIALARAFLANAPILILDEATSNLDSESEALIQDAVERLMIGRTSIVIAHRLSTMRILDRIVVLKDGNIIEDGTHDFLLQKNHGVYRRFFEKQAQQGRV